MVIELRHQLGGRQCPTVIKERDIVIVWDPLEVCHSQQTIVVWHSRIIEAAAELKRAREAFSGL